jgi:hypothetical protein
MALPVSPQQTLKRCSCNGWTGTITRAPVLVATGGHWVSGTSCSYPRAACALFYKQSKFTPHKKYQDQDAATVLGNMDNAAACSSQIINHRVVTGSDSAEQTILTSGQQQAGEERKDGSGGINQSIWMDGDQILSLH